MNKVNQDVQYQRETQHDISLKEHSQSAFCTLKHPDET